MKKIPLTKEEHEKLAEDLRKSQEILEPWMDRFFQAYSVKSRECKDLHYVLNLLSSKICDHQDDHWYRLGNDTNDSPYYGKGKSAWL
jgi:hypothetical protein